MTNLISKTQSAALALALGIAGAVLITAPSAQATVIFTAGNNPQPNEEITQFGSQQTGTTLTGNTNQSNTLVQFTSTQTLQTGGIGASFLEAASPANTITGNITTTVPGNTFDDFIFNATVTGPNATGGAATIVAVANDGMFSQDINLTNGANFWTLTTTGGEVINSVSLNPAAGTNYEHFQHINISGITPVTTPVPEPASLALLGSALVGFGLLRRRKS